jgi:hypothetical protein
MANKSELVHFLDEHVFHPILNARPGKYPEKDRKMLSDVQERTRTEQERYRKYPSAAEVRKMYMDDLHSENAREVNRHLKHLGLPILADVQDQFLKLADS